jgi:hypothetical protein
MRKSSRLLFPFEMYIDVALGSYPLHTVTGSRKFALKLQELLILNLNIVALKSLPFQEPHSLYVLS